jgi:ABC-type multidrug transport system ATPase subunit
MLLLTNVTKKYGDFTALEDVSLEFAGGVYALLAPNGAGKTTLIKMLTTLIFPTKGEILWNGDEIVRLDAAYRDIIGYLPQSSP